MIKIKSILLAETRLHIKNRIVPETVKRIVLVGNYPPRQCGIATFTQDLHSNLQLLMPEVTFVICAMNETILDTHAYPSDVVCQIDQEDAKSYSRAAEMINQHSDETVVIVQHEYGIYGGESGELLLDFLEAVQCPIMMTLHTVLANPSHKMRQVTQRITELCDQLIVLSDTSLKLLNELYPESIDKTSTILHGIHPVLYKDPSVVKPRFKLDGRPVMMTFGLLSRNKGIEYIISALPIIRKKVPDIMYLVVGGTHPAVVRNEGESYRLELMELVKQLGLQQHVKFLDDFLPVHEILDYLQATDIYVATSLDPEQAVSGTLSYALGAGRAVISTSFAQAKEVVDSQVGRVVPIRDSTAVATAAIELFGDPNLLESMNQSAYSRTRSMLWTNVADDYIALLTGLWGATLQRYPSFDLKHLESMTDKFGMLQFSKIAIPARASGYTLDDNSRALQIVCAARDMGLITEEAYTVMANKYLRVLRVCLSSLPQVNYLSAQTKLPTKQNLAEDLSDSLARAYYALQTASNSSAPELADQALKLLQAIPPSLDASSHIKTTTQLLLGSVIALEAGDESMRSRVDYLARILIDSYNVSSTDDWKWFQDNMTYASGQMCSSILDAARVTGSDEYRRVGLESLAYLSSICFMGDVYAPIGQSSWHNKSGLRSLFDQQPEDAYSMMHALQSALVLTGDRIYARQIEKVFSWFMGNNLIGARMYDDETAGCHDGLTPVGVNLNEGAESTLSYLGALIIIERLRTEYGTNINAGGANHRVPTTVVQTNTLII